MCSAPARRKLAKAFFDVFVMKGRESSSLTCLKRKSFSLAQLGLAGLFHGSVFHPVCSAYSHRHTTFGPLLDIQISFRVAGARDCAPCQKWAKREGFVAFPKRMAGMGHLKRICKDAFPVAGAVQKTCSSEMLGGQGADFLRGVASDLQVCWDDFAWQVQHFAWLGITFSWQVEYFRQVDWKNRKTHWYEAVSSALNFPFLKEVS